MDMLGCLCCSSSAAAAASPYAGARLRSASLLHISLFLFAFRSLLPSHVRLRASCALGPQSPSPLSLLSLQQVRLRRPCLSSPSLSSSPSPLFPPSSPLPYPVSLASSPSSLLPSPPVTPASLSSASPLSPPPFSSSLLAFSHFRCEYYAIRVARCVLRVAQCVLRVACFSMRVLRVARCVLRVAQCVLRAA